MSTPVPSSSTVRSVFDSLAPPGTPLTTPEVADEFDCTQRTIYNKLETLVEDGVLKTKKVGARGRVWWRPPQERIINDSSESPFAKNDPANLKETKTALQESEERLRLALAAADLGVWELNLQTEESSVRSRQHDRIFGYEERVDNWSFDRFIEHVHPDDREDVEQSFEGAFETDGWAFECRITRADDTERWIAAHGEFKSNADGEPIRAVGIVQDITERKERERELERYERIIEAVGEPVYELDERGRFTFVNDAMIEYSGYEESELLGNHVSIGIDEEAIDRTEEEIMGHLADGGRGSVTVEYGVTTKDGERIPAENRLSLVTDEEGMIRGTVGVLWDISERKQRERELEESRNRYRTLVENFPNGAVTLVNEELEYVTVGGTPIEEADATVADLEGGSLDVLLPRELADLVIPRYADAFEGEQSAFEGEIGDRVYQFRILPVRNDDGHVFAAMGMSQEITEQKEHERQLAESEQRYRTLVENFPNGAVGLFDDDFRYTLLGGEIFDGIVQSTDELQGQTIHEMLPPAMVDELEPRYRAVFEGERSEFEVEFDGQVRNFRIAPVHDQDGEVMAGLELSQDITERKAREKELQTQVTQQRTVASLGTRALEHPDLDDLFEQSATVVSETLDVEYCKVLELMPDGDHVFLRNGVGWRDGLIGEALVPTDLDSQAGYTLLSEEPVVVDDLRTETRFSGPELLTSHDVVSGISVIIGSVDEPWGVLGTHTSTPRTFSEHDVNFVQTVANILATAIERAGYEAKITHQNEQLAALNELNQVVQDVTDAVIDQSTREEIERIVCNQLADSESYVYAWIGHLDRHGQHIIPEAAGDDHVNLSEITLSLDTDDPTNEWLVGRAIRKREVLVSTNSTTDPVFERWNRSHDKRQASRISIPIAFEDHVYGVLNVYTTRERAFDAHEQQVVGQLGKVVGHAINSLERKRALLENRVQEVTMRSDALAKAFVEEAGADAITVSIDRTIPLPDDQTITYYTIDGLDPETYAEIEQGHRPDADFRLIGQEGSRSRLEVVTSGETLATILARYGGRIVEPIFQDGKFRIVVQLPQGTDVRHFTDAISTAYPGMELVSQVQVTRQDRTLEDTVAMVDEQMTERQRTTLEVAHYAGFFNWPRDTTGEELADRLGVSPSTLHYHLRHGEYKLMSAFFEVAKRRNRN